MQTYNSFNELAAAQQGFPHMSQMSVFNDAASRGMKWEDGVVYFSGGSRDGKANLHLKSNYVDSNGLVWGEVIAQWNASLDELLAMGVPEDKLALPTDPFASDKRPIQTGVPFEKHGVTIPTDNIPTNDVFTICYLEEKQGGLYSNRKSKTGKGSNFESAKKKIEKNVNEVLNRIDS